MFTCITVFSTSSLPISVFPKIYLKPTGSPIPIFPPSPFLSILFFPLLPSFCPSLFLSTFSLPCLFSFFSLQITCSLFITKQEQSKCQRENALEYEQGSQGFNAGIRNQIQTGIASLLCTLWN